MLEWRPCAHVDCWETLDGGDVVAAQLVLSIKAHDLAKLIDRLHTLREHALDRELEFLEQRVEVLCHWSRLVPPLDGAASS